MSKKEAAAPRAGRGKSWLIPLLVSVVAAAVAGGGAAWFFVSRAAPPAAIDGAAAVPEAPKAPAQYIPIEPVFVVNLADEEVRYLQVEIQVVTREPTTAADMKTHMPMIRNRLLLLFSQQKASGLRTREDKERLQAEALAEVQAVLTEVTGKPGIEALLFTSFVSQ